MGDMEKELKKERERDIMRYMEKELEKRERERWEIWRMS